MNALGGLIKVTGWFLLSLFTVLVIAWHSLATAEGFGSWHASVTDDGESHFAATVNESDNLLGQYCFLKSGNCLWMLGMRTSCKEGDKYAVLANSDTGAAHITVYCNAQLANGLYRYVFSEFDAIDNIVKAGLRVGFAVPLETDNFRIVRFDLGGASRTIALMRAAASKTAENKPLPRNTKDQDL